ncbi:glycoside hydrolase family 47 protein [Lepidopterella palustris CBS 459.81]|uniref:alpha-1,2-Mannosidase n=1 Tax=Lepidopterella palustris CBS 459.81 TaxID=1314670 RepID=A0A8E2E4H3_9PEZI|nr:glycoside hydrolase family 47 protein [Lepidopterella palustris CBS 459.81]
MNTRDPFNLHKGSTAFTVLQHSATRAASSAASYTRQAGQQALEAGKQALDNAGIADGMSFAVPRNVPSFTDPQRRYEDNAWGSSGRSRFAENGHGHGNGGVAEKIGGIFGDKKVLPMYKDKPYNYGASMRRRRWFKMKRVIGPLLVLVFGLFYWVGWSPSGKSKGAKGSWVMFSETEENYDWDERREAVKDAFKLSWDAYEKHAWGYDEFHPVSKRGRYMATNGLGWIIVDALDTMMLMNLTKELAHAREWISTSLDYEKDQDVNTFETTIRMLGGFLSAHYLASTLPGFKPAEGAPEDDLWLEKASDLADRLLGAYESASGVPYASVNLKTRQGIPSHADGGASSTAEATSLQLEMKYLAFLTGEAHYWEKAEKVMEVVDNNGAKDGLVPIFIYADRGNFRSNEIRLGSRGDSYYEYLIKQYYQTSKQEPIYLDMWNEALTGVRKHLITYSKPSNFTVLAERPSGLDGHIHPKMDHLVCFMPGTIALGATGGLNVTEAKKLPSWGTQQEEEMELATQLMKTCWGMYKATATGLAPEIAHFNIYDPPQMMRHGVLSSPEALDIADDAEWRQDFVIKPADVHNLQRPETVESLFYMWRITGDSKYREWGWEMFEAFVKYTMVNNGSGFSSIGNVNEIPPPTRDNMESFWLAETLKYFYLLFGPNDILPLDQIVLNTEAHPFPRFEPDKKRLVTGWKRILRDAAGNLVREEEKEEVKVEAKSREVVVGLATEALIEAQESGK